VSAVNCAAPRRHRQGKPREPSVDGSSTCSFRKPPDAAPPFPSCQVVNFGRLTLVDYQTCYRFGVARARARLVRSTSDDDLAASSAEGSCAVSCRPHEHLISLKEPCREIPQEYRVSAHSRASATARPFVR
jgi:hypothetical protein